MPGDIVGKAGAEAQFENVLQGDRGRRVLEVDARGTAHRVIEDIEPVPGRDVQLTIDSKVQKVTEAALAQALRDAHKDGFPKARAGAAVALDVKTGEILSMASLPTYDPKSFLGGDLRQDLEGPQRQAARSTRSRTARFRRSTRRPRPSRR